MKNFIIALSFLIGINLFAGELSLHDYVNNKTEENFSKVYNYYVQKINQNHEDYDALISLAMLTQIASNNYENMIKDNFKNLGIREKFLFANFLLQKGKYNESIDIYNQLNKIAPKWSCPWRHKGEAYLAIKKYNEAENAVIQAIKVKKNHFDAYILLAEIQEKMEKYPEALKTMETGLKYQDQNTEKEEITDKDVLILYSRILKENNKMKKFKEIQKKLEKK
jgi:tetratricopeptide (TPR) repeat protein